LGNNAGSVADGLKGQSGQRCVFRCAHGCLTLFVTLFLSASAMKGRYCFMENSTARISDSDQMASLLGQLGLTAGGVAASLWAKRIKGVRNTVRFLNPVVRLAQAILQQEAVSLDVRTGRTLRITYHYQDRQVDVALPEAVIEFLGAFNRGEFPNLEIAEGDTW
jgi:hypothetical protein